MFEYNKNALRQSDLKFKLMFDFKNIFISHLHYRISEGRA